MPDKDDKKIIILAGNERSGTTLLACLLDGHPQIMPIIGETRFFQRFLTIKNRFENEDIDQAFLNLTGRAFDWQAKGMQKIGTHIDREKNWRPHAFWQEIEKSSQNIKAGEEILKKAILSKDDKKVFLQLANLYKKYVWLHSYEPKYILEKTPQNEFHLAKIFKLFPQAKVIHLVRDPFDVIESILKNGKKEGLMSYIYTWKKSINEGIKHQKKYPNNYRFVKHENVVQNTVDTMHKLADFLEIDFDESLTQPTTHCGKNLWDGQKHSHQNIKAEKGKISGRMLAKNAEYALGGDFMEIIGSFVSLEYGLFNWDKYATYINGNLFTNIIFKKYPNKNFFTLIKNIIKYFLYLKNYNYKKLIYF